MDPNFFEDNNEEDFATSAEHHRDVFFDLGFDYRPESLESSDASNSIESNFFDDLSVGSASRDLFAREPYSMFEVSIPDIPSGGFPSVPRSQKLVHQLRPEGMAISSSQLLALENKDHKPLSLRATAPSSSRPTTPPSTPLNRRSQPLTPASGSRRTHRVKKSRSGTATSGSSRIMQASSYCSTSQEPPTFDDWTERFRQVAIQGPNQAFPLSPPPSAKVSQEEYQNQQLQQEQLIPAPAFDLPDDIFGSGSQNNITGSTLSGLPSTGDFYQPTPISQLGWGSEDSDQNFFSSAVDPWQFSSLAVDVNPASTVTADQSLANAHHHFDMVDAGFGSEGLLISFDDLTGLDQNSGSSNLGFAAPASIETPIDSIPAVVNNESQQQQQQQQQDQDQKEEIHNFLYLEQPPPAKTRQQPASISRLSRAKSIPEKLIHGNSSPSPTRKTTITQKLHHRRTRSSGAIRTPKTPKTPRTPRKDRNSSSAAAGNSTAAGSSPSKSHTHSRSAGHLQEHSQRGRQGQHSYKTQSRNQSQSQSQSAALLSPSHSQPGQAQSHAHLAAQNQGLGFVNFTPQDSMKILTGVAPSGSSKTKARREKEASERRRKLSEAAERAVMVAGGDLEAMRRELSV